MEPSLESNENASTKIFCQNCVRPKRRSSPKVIDYSWHSRSNVRLLTEHAACLYSFKMDRLTVERRSWLMGRVGSKNTTPELAVRRLVFSMGYRYRLHDIRLPGKPDLVFSGRRKVIFVNGCFWHGHKRCRYARLPKTNVDFWREKIERNRARDRKNKAQLTRLGWGVLVVWQCELRNIEKLSAKLYDFFERD